MLQKRAQESINSRLTLVMKSGKFTLGTKTALKTLRNGKGTSHEAEHSNDVSNQLLLRQGFESVCVCLQPS